MLLGPSQLELVNSVYWFLYFLPFVCSREPWMWMDAICAVRERVHHRCAVHLFMLSIYCVELHAQCSWFNVCPHRNWINYVHLFSFIFSCNLPFGFQNLMKVKWTCCANKRTSHIKRSVRSIPSACELVFPFVIIIFLSFSQLTFLWFSLFA